MAVKWTTNTIQEASVPCLLICLISRMKGAEIMDLPDLKELQKLPLRSVVAYAARCATRVHTMYDATARLPAGERARHKQAVYDAIVTAHQFAANRIEAFAEAIRQLDSIGSMSESDARSVGILEAAAGVSKALVDVIAAARVVKTPDDDPELISARQSGNRAAFTHIAISSGGAAGAAKAAVNAATATNAVVGFIVSACASGLPQCAPAEIYENAADAAQNSLAAQLAGAIAADLPTAAACQPLIQKTRRDYADLLGIRSERSGIFGEPITTQLGTSVW